MVQKRQIRGVFLVNQAHLSPVFSYVFNHNPCDLELSLSIIYRYTDAAAFLLRWGLAADKCNATHSQCKVWTNFLMHILCFVFTLFFINMITCGNGSLDTILCHLFV